MPSASLRYLSPLVDALESNGVAVDTLTPPSSLPTSEQRVSERQLRELWDAAVTATGNPLLGLQVGLSVAALNLGVLGYALRNATTIRQAYTLLDRYRALIYDAPLLEVLEANGEAVLRVVRKKHASPNANRPAVEYLMASLLHLSGDLLGGPRRGNQFLRRIEFRHQPGGPLEQYQQLLKSTEIDFNCEHSAVVFDAEVFDQPIRWANPKLLSAMTARADEQLRLMATEHDAVARVKSAIRRRLIGSAPRIHKIADDCAMSRATLQRKLAASHTSYQQLLDAVRLDIAQEMLSDRNTPIASIAFALGYSEPAAFHHAYKRWTGGSPQRDRRSFA